MHARTQCTHMHSVHNERMGVLEFGGIQLIAGKNYATKPFRRTLIKAMSNLTCCKHIYRSK